MENFFLEELYDPEYYHEIEGFDSRVAILKFNDLSNTISEALISIMYSDINDFDEVKNNINKYIVLRHRIRHAIIDLNNCFDLLLQALWFFYRIWEYYNSTGSLRTSNLNNGKNYIIRNSDCWVEKAEEKCNYKRLLEFLKASSDPDLLSFANKLKTFYDSFVYNNSKKFTIRTLANNMKHKEP